MVAELIARQFPRWSGLRVKAVKHQGWDNRTFRLGSDLVVRLPTSPRVERQAAIEVDVLPALAAGVSLPIPTVVAVGHGEPTYPFRWTVLNWLDGTPLRDEVGVDQRLLASDLAAFLLELRLLSPAGGPIHPVGLGQPLQQWDGQVGAALERLGDRIDTRRARTIWAAALRASEQSASSWFHGDIAPGNLLMRDGRLGAVIDFGSVGVGDPSCDLAFAWTALGAEGREVFRRKLAPDEAEWRRGMGWALWFGLTRADDPDDGASARHVLEALSVLV
ncbi:aminoglycoside phosphotransferase family protein [Amnibacterium kyonggiense]|nr:aminoglycoside phosphotransferase family protein [Amnibacterium kyonggiense]